MSLDFLGLEVPNEHRLAWDNKDWNKVKELCKEFKKDKDKSTFEIINNVTQKTGHKNVMVFESYDQYTINSWLSQHASMNGYASELNQWAGYITDQMHYDYLYYTVRKCKLPYVAYARASDDWDFVFITHILAHHYNVSYEKAVEYHDLHTDEQMKRILRDMRGLITSPDCPFMSVLPKHISKTEKARLYKTATKW